MSITFYVPNHDEVELNLSNMGAHSALRALELESSDSGSIEPILLLAKLFVHGSALPEQYVSELRFIAEVALHQGKQVVWA